MKVIKEYKYPQKSFGSYFAYFETCVLLGTVPLCLSLSPEQVAYKIGFLVAIPVATLIVYSVLKVNIKAQNMVSLKLCEEGIVYKDAASSYEMPFDRIQRVGVETIEKWYMHRHRIMTLYDGSKKVSLTSFITDEPRTIGFASGFKHPDTARGDELFDLIAARGRRAIRL